MTKAITGVAQEKTVYIGHIKNAICDTKTLVVAENPEEAKAKVLAKFSTKTDDSCSEVCISVRPFGNP